MPDEDFQRLRRWVVTVLGTYQGDRCFYCGRATTIGTGDVHRDTDRTIDHIIPRSRGGGNNLGNLCLCCQGCNSAKAGRMLWEWLSPVGLGVFVG